MHGTVYNISKDTAINECVDPLPSVLNNHKLKDSASTFSQSAGIINSDHCLGLAAHTTDINN